LCVMVCSEFSLIDGGYHINSILLFLCTINIRNPAEANYSGLNKTLHETAKTLKMHRV
jgi:hypothetical protein